MQTIIVRGFVEMCDLAVQTGLSLEDLAMLFYLSLHNQDRQTLKAHFERHLKAQ